MGKRFKKKCLRSGPCPVRDLPHGCRARVCNLEGDMAQRSHLCSMGLTPGTEVEVCKDFPGRCRLRVRGCSLALDGELACRIICEPC